MNRDTQTDALATPLTAEEIVRLESENGLRQYDAAAQIIENAIKAGVPFVLQPDLILEMHRIAVDGLEPTPGAFRTKPVGIKNTTHKPPPAEDVVRYVTELCDMVNAVKALPAIRQAALVLWRINWIHPFGNGNGRTARMVSYIVLCVRLGMLLPGKTTIPEQIAAEKAPYYAGLDAADAAWKQGVINVNDLEKLLETLLVQQLSSQ